ncbi:MAG: YkgJ family cysteine cluster protein [Deltaproteobacteria bacterium]|nr:YkgJ family cysteine cluster protein [Deltaproteobacteria bacterium]MBN2672810.1 YkgJ family cysteine cluster protein [Deltaproteobacteria bacterium]
MSESFEKPFYENGLQFECTGCGACCKTHGDYAYVYLNHDNVDAISEYLGMTRIDFLNAHCANDEYGNVHLTMVEGQCNFLKDDKCVVYAVRPHQCRSWPFWTENLTEECWYGEVSDCCPGIGRGKRYSKEEIEKIAQDRDKAYGIDF